LHQFSSNNFRPGAIVTALMALTLALLVLAAPVRALTFGTSTITTTIKGYGTVTVTSGAEPHPTCTSPASTPQGTSYTGCPTVNGSQHDDSGVCGGNVCTRKVTLTATAPSGWHFAGWSGDCTGTGTCTHVDETSDCEEVPCEIEFSPTDVTASFADDRAPTTTFGTAPAANSIVYSDTQSQTFTWSTNEDNESPTFGCKKDAGAFSACSSGLTWSSIADGIHDFCVHATDASGLEGADACRHWEQETNPTASISAHPPSINSSPSATFGYTSNKTNHPSDGSTLRYECKIDSGSFGACPGSYSSLADGSHTFQVRAVFTGALGGGAHTSTAASYTWTQDTTPPVISMTSGPATGSTVVDSSGHTGFGFSASDATTGVSAIECGVDGGALGPCTSATSEVLDGLADGEHELVVKATDGAGLSSTQDVVWEQEAPADTIFDAAPGEGSLVPSRTAHFAFHSDKTSRPVSFQCALDSATFVPCSGALSEDLAGLPDGPHTLQVRAVFTASIDGSQHAGPAISRSWMVDATPPDTTIVAGPADGSVTTEVDPTFVFTSTEGDAFVCSLDGGPFGTCSSPLSLHVSPGKHTFAVQARDAAGNADPTPALRSWTVSLPALGANVAATWKMRSGYTSVKSLTVTSVPAGATIVVSCKGKRASCRFKKKTMTVGSATPQLALAKLFKKARLSPGTRIEVRITKPGTVGVDVTFKTRKRKRPTEKQVPVETSQT
jgi:hypothetical protein